MKRTTKKLLSYGIIHLFINLFFLTSIAFAILALIYRKHGLTIWAIISIIFVLITVLFWEIKHFIWYKMSKLERAFYLAIRQSGKKTIDISYEDVNSKKGQKDLHSFLKDKDIDIEAEWIINGLFPFLGLYISINWLFWAHKFNKGKTRFYIEFKKKK